jgi:hypothetical protein
VKNEFISAVIAEAKDSTAAAIEAAAIVVWPRTRGARSRAPNPFCAYAQNGTARRAYRAPCAPEYGEFGGHAAQWPQTKRSITECSAVKSQIVRDLQIAWLKSHAS